MSKLTACGRRRGLGTIGAIVVAMLGAGCGSGGTAPATAPVVTAAATPSPVAKSDVVLRLTAEQPAGKDVQWDLGALEAPAGLSFDVSLTNTDDARHDFAVVPVDGLLSDIIFKSEVVGPNDAAVVTVPGLAAGTYEFICSLHSTEMRGELTVT